jgi:hypothetical protein
LLIVVFTRFFYGICFLSLAYFCSLFLILVFEGNSFSFDIPFDHKSIKEATAFGNTLHLPLFPFLSTFFSRSFTDRDLSGNVAFIFVFLRLELTFPFQTNIYYIFGSLPIHLLRPKNLDHFPLRKR